MINLEYYRIFLHTARAGNLTKAAQELYITQPSVSYAVKQLEQSYGLKLFHRLSKGVELTAEGSALLEYVERSLSLLEAGERKVHALRRLEGGEIRVGAGDSHVRHLLLPALDRFHREYPAVRIRLSHGKSPDIVLALTDGRIDCGVVHLPVAEPELKAVPLAEVRSCFVAGTAYREALEGRALAAEEVARLPLILLSSGSSTRRFVEQWFGARGLAVEPDIELGSVDLLLECARLGFGVAFVNRALAAEALRDDRLFELRLEEELPARSLGVAVRRDRPLPVAAARFAEMLSEWSAELRNREVPQES